MNIQQAIELVLDHQDLDTAAMTAVMQQIMGGQATPAQIGGFLIGLRMKGESVTEIAAAASVMRQLATPVAVDPGHLLDTCGTGGDGANTFNISTAVAFVAAAAGCRVAKHGNRSVSSKSGSADVLEAAGVRLDLDPQQVARCIDKVGVGFMFAPAHHSAMKHAIGPRRELAVRTLFNLLGPLTNPAGAPSQVMGVFAANWTEPLARVLRQLGSRHVLVVHADDGLDEISIATDTRVTELVDRDVRTYTLKPEDFGIERHGIEALAVSSADQSLAMIHAVFDNNPGPARDIVLLNAGAAIYAADRADSLADGIEQARGLIASGAAGQRLEQLITFSQSL